MKKTTQAEQRQDSKSDRKSDTSNKSNNQNEIGTDEFFVLSLNRTKPKTERIRKKNQQHDTTTKTNQHTWQQHSEKQQWEREQKYIRKESMCWSAQRQCKNEEHNEERIKKSAHTEREIDRETGKEEKNSAYNRTEWINVYMWANDIVVSVQRWRRLTRCQTH